MKKKTKTFYKVQPDGDTSYCVFHLKELINIADWLDGAEEGFFLKVSKIELTEKQFEKLPEYEG